MTDSAAPTPAIPTGRERLHPLSPLMRGSRTAVGLIAILALSQVDRSSDGRGNPEYDAIAVGVALVIGFIHWYVTWWSFDGSTLTVETGLLRRDVRKVPVVRIQAVDIIQPLLGKFLDVAELRIRTAGTGKDERLAYLRHGRALQLRATLLATHHGLDPATPVPDEQPVAVVPGGRLAASVALSAPTALLVALLVAIGILAAFSTKAAASVAAASSVYLIGDLTGIWRRFNGQYNFTIAVAPDGIRVRRGLLGTVAETIPTRRVQAIRQVEPLAWRPLHWSRLDVDLAGIVRRDSSGGSRSMTRTLLPVGPNELVATVRAFVVAPNAVTRTRPPRRARWKSPLSYHNLAAGHDAALAVATTGRLQRVTSWVPLDKVQSVRKVQGPLQRMLGLATVHLDVAGRGGQAAFRDRDAREADQLLDDLVVRCRSARLAASNEARAVPGDAHATVAVPPRSAEVDDQGIGAPAGSDVR